MNDSNSAPLNAASQIELGNVFKAQGQWREAAECYLSALHASPNDVTALVKLGAIRQHQGRPAEAEEVYRRAWSCEPNNSAVLNNLGSALSQQGLHAEAADCFSQSLRLRPGSYATHYNLGLSLHEQGQIHEAVEHYSQSLAIEPRHADAHFSLGNAMQELGQFSHALAHYDRAITLNPQHAEAQWNRALVLVQTGDFQRGWPAYECRWQAVEKPNRPAISIPHWDGSSLADRSVLIYGEQGIGDEIIFASCYGDVLRRAQQSVITCDPRLERLFRRSFPSATICGVKQSHENGLPAVAQACHVQVAAGSLPSFVRPSFSSFPRRTRYLFADSTTTQNWRRRLAEQGSGLRIGISWRAAVTDRERRKRATALEQWLPVLKLPGVQFVCLQHGRCDEELAAIRNQYGIEILHFPEADPLGDLDNMAALVSALDMVITVGNATAHLAGALGILTWTILPLAWGWRWFTGREDSPWYSSMRLFRQQRLGDWDQVIARVADELRRMAES